MLARFSVVLALLAAVAAPAAAQPLTKITIVETGAGSATRWPAYAAQEKGLFRAAGLDIEFLPASASSGVMQQVASASAPMGAGSPVDALRAIDKGAPISILRLESTQAPYEVFARASIRKLADLRGKTIMIGGAKDITRFYIEKMLAPNGVRPGEYDFVYAGATAQRYLALQSGSIDASILAAPFNFKAAGAGFSNLGATPDYVRDVPFSAFLVNIPWAKQNRAVIDRFLGAYEQGVEWFYDPANRSEAIDILQKISKAERGDVEKTWDFYTALKVIDRTGFIENKGLAELLAVLKAQGDLEGSTEIGRFYDLSLGAKAR